MLVLRIIQIVWLFPKRTLTAVCIALFTVILVGCSSSDDDDSSESNLPLSGDLSSDVNSDPDAEIAKPWINGFRLVRESRESASGLVFSDDRFVLGADGRSFERSPVSDAGDQPATIEVIHRYDDNGFIVSRVNLSSDGSVSQRFDSTYDSRGRKSAEQSYNGVTPFLTSSYERDSNDRLTRQQVISTENGGLWSSRTYAYSSSGVLESITLTSPLLSYDLIHEFTFDDATGQLIEKREIDAATGGVDSTTSYIYDNDGNLTVAEERGASGAVTLTSRFEYEVAEDSVPNLPLHEMTHDIDQL